MASALFGGEECEAEEVQYITGGKLGEAMVQNEQLVDPDDWVGLVWDLGYEQPEIGGPWRLIRVV